MSNLVINSCQEFASNLVTEFCSKNTRLINETSQKIVSLFCEHSSNFSGSCEEFASRVSEGLSQMSLDVEDLSSNAVQQAVNGFSSLNNSEFAENVMTSLRSLSPAPALLLQGEGTIEGVSENVTSTAEVVFEKAAETIKVLLENTTSTAGVVSEKAAENVEVLLENTTSTAGVLLNNATTAETASNFLSYLKDNVGSISATWSTSHTVGLVALVAIAGISTAALSRCAWNKPATKI